jgi:hypothetical protein
MAKKLKDVNKDGKVNFKDTWLGERLSTKGKLKGPNLAESLKGARRSSDTSATESKPASKPASTSAPTSSIRPKSKPVDSGSRVGAKERKVQTTAELRKAAEAKKATTTAVTTPTVDKKAQRTALKSVGPIGGMLSGLQVRPNASLDSVSGRMDRKMTKDTARPSFDVDYDQWLKMTPAKRKELGLPATYGAIQRMLGTKMKTQTKNRFKFYNRED